jgi:5-methyltetrahydrofolate--homocysteine methyltransferase
VRGDVHDIGKNIVGVVLACNNYSVTDLGVMTPCEKIIEEARRINPDFIGLSGLITPSLDEMAAVAKELKRSGFTTPLLIGGATTSEDHTAIKLAQHYDGPVVHVSDASLVTGVCSDLLNPQKKNSFIETLKEDQKTKREAYEKNQPAEIIPLAEARKNRLQLKPASLPIPKKSGVTLFEKIGGAEVAELIDWTPFFVTWSLKGSFPKIFNSEKYGAEARKLFDDARRELDLLIKENRFHLRGVAGIWSARRVDDDIVVFADQSQKNPIWKIAFSSRPKKTQSG